MRLIVLPFELSVIRLEPTEALPEWIQSSAFYSLTRTPDELSIFAETRCVPEVSGRADGWRALRVAGMLDLELTGVISQLAVPLATRQISIFSISTHDTDYIIVHGDRLEDALYVLRKAGHQIETGE
jgi:hypothetical protein